MKILFLLLFSFSVYSQQIPLNIVLSMISVESSFNTNAIGDNGKAFGLMQIHKAAAKDVGFNENIKKLLSPKLNVKIGLKYLNLLYSKRSNLWCTVSAYNKGFYAIKEKDLKNNCENHIYVKKVKERLKKFYIYPLKSEIVFIVFNVYHQEYSLSYLNLPKDRLLEQFF